jgi:hypothetical protein
MGVTPAAPPAEDAVVQRLLAHVPRARWVPEGLAPIAWHLLRRRGMEPPADLSQEAHVSLIRWEILARGAAELSRSLSREGVAAAFLKGTDLNLRAYPEPGLRPMADVDLLVPAGALDVVRRVVGDLGYEALDRPGDPPANTAFERSFRRARDEADLDVHLAVDWPEALGVGTDDLLRRRDLAGPEALPVLAPADLLLNVACHSLRDFRPAATLGILDAFFVLTRLRPSWDEVLARALGWRARPALRLLLERLHRFAGVPVPGRVRRALGVGLIPRAVGAWFVSAFEGPPGLSLDWLERAARLGMVESPGQRWRLALRYAGLRGRTRSLRAGSDGP